MLNKIFLQGRLGSDPELKNTPNGTEVCTVNIAVDRDRKGPDGEKVTDWFTVTAWKGLAKFLSGNFTKGRTILIEGRLQMRNWTDRDGNKRTSAEVVADNIYFGDSKKDDPLNGLVQNMGGTSYGMPTSDNFAELSDDGPLPF